MPEETASRIAERVLRNLAQDDPPPRSRFLAEALEECARASLATVARERRDATDPQRHRDPEDQRYPANLDLDRLQAHDAERGFHDREWNQLPAVLKPLAFAQLGRKGITASDAEDVFHETLAEFARERARDGKAPITDISVFEEIVPLQSRMLQFRAIDWIRRRSTLKNQPNTGESFDAMVDDPDRPVQFADPRSDGPPSFEEIYRHCHEALKPAEWDLLVQLYIARSATIQDLIHDPEFCATLDLKPGASASTRRRAVNARLETALSKLRKCLTP